MGGLFSKNKNKNLQAVKKEEQAVVEPTGFKKLDEPVAEKADSGQGDTGAAAVVDSSPPAPETIGAVSTDDPAPTPESTGAAAADSTPPPTETITPAGEDETQEGDSAAPSAAATVSMSSKVGVSVRTKNMLMLTFTLQSPEDVNASVSNFCFKYMWHYS